MSADEQHIINELTKVVEGLGRLLNPFCEVLLHDLRDLDHAVVAIENNLSGRKIGDATTQMGRTRILNPDFPDIVANYRNTLPDGRAVKALSVGIRNRDGAYVAALCLNFDISALSSLNSLLAAFMSSENDALPVQEHLRSMSIDQIQTIIGRFAMQCGKAPHSLSSAEKAELISKMTKEGWLGLKNAIPITASILGVTRASVYNYRKRFLVSDPIKK